MNSDNPYSTEMNSPAKPADDMPGATQIGSALAFVVVLAIGGGIVCGSAIHRFGELGDDGVLCPDIEVQLGQSVVLAESLLARFWAGQTV